MSEQAPVTVVVPVYGGPDATRRCLESIVRHAPSCTTPFELLVIDDCTPDAALRDDIERFAHAPAPVAVRAVRNETNLGFVESVNLGMRSTTGDVVLLNADTVVTDGWLDRLVAAAASSPEVATVTPLSNAGSICTLPERVIERFGLAGPDPRIDECATFVATYGLGEWPAVITGVGFCLLIRRQALDDCGLFDVETFGKGYGEEVDFCLRATQVGYRHLVDDRTFVFHEEGTSFGGERAERMARGEALLRQRYPYFAPANRREQAESPLAVTFEALELALGERRPGRPHVLHVLGRAPGSADVTARHVEALVTALSDRFDNSVLFPVESGFGLRTSFTSGAGDRITHHHLLPGLRARSAMIDDEAAGAALELALDLYDFDAIHLHSLVGYSLAPLRVCEDRSVPVMCTVDDGYLACPNHTLRYHDARPCGVPDDLAVCEACLPHTTVAEPVEFLEEFRREVARRLDRIDRFVVADVTTADLLGRAEGVRQDRIEVIERVPVAVGRPDRPLDERRLLTGPLRVAFVDRGGNPGGVALVNRLADELRGTDVEIHHIGPVVGGLGPEVRAHRRYRPATLGRLLRKAGIAVVVPPDPFAESCDLVTAEALAAGLPLLGRGHSPLGHRIRVHGVGWTVELGDAGALAELLSNLDRCRPELLRAARQAANLSGAPLLGLADRYAALYPTQTTRNEESAMDDDRSQRQLRALTAVNWQLHAQLREAQVSQQARLAAQARSFVERSRPRARRLYERGLVAGAIAWERMEQARKRRSG